MERLKYFAYSTSVMMLLDTANLAFAAENGSPTTAPGIYDFGAGFLPPYSPYGMIGIRASYYSADKNKNLKGNKINDPFKLSVLAVGVSWIKMTNNKILGANYGFGIVQPFFDMDMHLTVPAPTGSLSLSHQVFRQADLQVLPVILGWNFSPNFSANFQFQIQAPTGYYKKSDLVSPGLNHWVYSPIINATYITKNGYEFSSSLETDINTKNKDTNYKNGIEYRYEFAAGKHINNWTVGLGGYYYNQFTKDKNNTGDIGKSQVFAYGPAISYFGGKAPSVWFHFYKEDGAKMRSEGYNVAIRVAQSF